MRHQRPAQQREVFSGNDFGDQVAFTVGSSFCIGFILGLGRGVRNGLPKSFKMPKKLILNNLFNSLGKQTSRMGNAFAAAGLMYYFVSAALNLLFEDNFETMIPIYKNMICGGATGMLYKSTLGLVPTFMGGLIGVGLIGGLTLVVEEGNRKGFIAFEMK